MSKFKIGDRVRILVNIPPTPGWVGAWGAKAGAIGTVDFISKFSTEGCGVIADGDPDHISMWFQDEELEAES